jgi:hypothetical protein
VVGVIAATAATEATIPITTMIIIAIKIITMINATTGTKAITTGCLHTGEMTKGGSYRETSRKARRARYQGSSRRDGIGRG